MRHLTEPQAIAALGRGARIEQMLSTDLSAGSFRWLAAVREDGRFVLRVHETMNDGSVDYLDVYEFRAANENDEFGEGVVAASADEAEGLVAVARQSGARPDRWVNAGVIQDEYADLIATR